MIKNTTIVVLLFWCSIPSIWSLTLHEAVETALKNNVDLKVEKLNRDIAFTRHNNALLGLLPDITLAYNYALDETGYWGSSESKTTQFMIEQPIFYNGKELFIFLSAYYAWKKSSNDYETKRKQVLIETVNKYMDLLKKQETVRIWALEIESAEKQRIKINKMFDLQFAARKDVLESESYLKEARYYHTKASNDYDMSKLEFEHYLKIPITDVTDTSLPVVDPKDYTYYFNYAQTHSIEYENLILTQKAARFQYKASQLARWPQLSVFVKNSQMDEKSLEYGISINLTGLLYSSATGSYGLQRNNNLWDTDKKNVSFRASLFTGDSTKESILKGEIDYLTMENELSDKNLSLEKIVKKAFFQFTEARDYFDMSSTAEEAKQETLMKTSKEYDLGLIDSMKLIEAQKELSEAKVNHLNGKYNYIIAWYTLLMTVGADISFN